MIQVSFPPNVSRQPERISNAKGARILKERRKMKGKGQPKDSQWEIAKQTKQTKKSSNSDNAHAKILYTFIPNLMKVYLFSAKLRLI